MLIFLPIDKILYIRLSSLNSPFHIGAQFQSNFIENSNNVLNCQYKNKIVRTTFIKCLGYILYEHLVKLSDVKHHIKERTTSTNEELELKYTYI